MGRVREGFEIPLAITFRFILGEMRLRKRNVLISQWHLLLSFPAINNP